MQALQGWDDCKRQIAGLLRVVEPDGAWAGRLQAAAAQMRELAARDPDAGLYLLMQTAATEVDRYSAHHAMLCALVGELCATWFEWPAQEVQTLVLAALTMNISMSATQDALARQADPLSQAQREEVESHAQRSAALLAKAGVHDALWLEAVRRHHEKGTRDAELPAQPEARLAQLLHRVDVYTAKLSRRATRQPASPALAARDACLSPAGVPDPVGAALLRVLGLYPPGSFVLLRSGETAIVVRRGAKAHTPLVAALRRADGGLYMPPVRRDTALSRQAVLRGVGIGEVKVRLDHLRVLGAV